MRIGGMDDATAYMIDAAIRSASSDPLASVANRRVACLFSMANLLYSGAVAESNIDQCIAENEERQFNPARAPLLGDGQEALEHVVGWRGDAVGSTRNVVGRVSFLTTLLFFFEGFAKIVAPEERIRRDTKSRAVDEATDRSERRIEATVVAEWLKGQRIVTDKEQRRSIYFLINYRNGWHSFGTYTGGACYALDGTLKLETGRVLPILTPRSGLGLLDHLLDSVVKLDVWYTRQSGSSLERRP